MKPASRHSAFTLIELLMVIAIIGILAAIAMPSLKNFRAQDALAASTRQLLDDVSRARQYAISQRTTVYMIFCPSNFWSTPMMPQGWPNPGWNSLPLTEKVRAAKLFDKQLTGYTFVTLRSVGEQPGQLSPRYLSSWRMLPEGAIIPAFKFDAPNLYTRITDFSVTPNRYYDIYGFAVTNNIPFPSAEASLNPGAPYVPLPYVAFNHQGQLESGRDEYIPVARGSINYSRTGGIANAASPNVTESPAGNSTNAFMLVHIDWLTGRARLVKQEFR